MPGNSSLLDKITAFEERNVGTASDLSEKVRKRINYLKGSATGQPQELHTLTQKQTMLKDRLASVHRAANRHVDNALERIQEIAGGARQKNRVQKEVIEAPVEADKSESGSEAEKSDDGSKDEKSDDGSKDEKSDDGKAKKSDDGKDEKSDDGKAEKSDDGKAEKSENGSEAEKTDDGAEAEQSDEETDHEGFNTSWVNEQRQSFLNAEDPMHKFCAAVAKEMKRGKHRLGATECVGCLASEEKTILEEYLWTEHQAKLHAQKELEKAKQDFDKICRRNTELLQKEEQRKERKKEKKEKASKKHKKEKKEKASKKGFRE